MIEAVISPSVQDSHRQTQANQLNWNQVLSVIVYRVSIKHRQCIFLETFSSMGVASYHPAINRWIFHDFP
jgi:hypothetical protein